jgi:hypothetical protein
MKLLRLSLLCFALLPASTIQLAAENLPEFRPALIGNHHRSLINLINAQSLMDR